MSNKHLNRIQRHPNDEYYTSWEEVDYVMSRLKASLPKKTLYVFSADPEWSEFVKWAKAKHLNCIYDVDMFHSFFLAMQRSMYYDKVCFVTNPPFSLLKYWLPLLKLVIDTNPNKFCYFLLVPHFICASRYCRDLWTKSNARAKFYKYPSTQWMFDKVNNKLVDMHLVVFATDLNMDLLFPEPPRKIEYVHGEPEILLPVSALVFERTLNQQGYFLADWEVRPPGHEFLKQRWIKRS